MPAKKLPAKTPSYESKVRLLCAGTKRAEKSAPVAADRKDPVPLPHVTLSATRAGERLRSRMRSWPTDGSLGSLVYQRPHDCDVSAWDEKMHGDTCDMSFSKGRRVLHYNLQKRRVAHVAPLFLAICAALFFGCVPKGHGEPAGTIFGPNLKPKSMRTISKNKYASDFAGAALPDAPIRRFSALA